MMPVLALNERMSGWLTINGQQQDFSVQIDACADRLLPIGQPMPFSGFARLGQYADACPISGSLTLRVSGPAYDIRIFTPDGTLNCVGHKTYNWRFLKASLTHCPLRVYRDALQIGGAELVYREPLWRFALESVRLRWVNHSANPPTNDQPAAGSHP